MRRPVRGYVRRGTLVDAGSVSEELASRLGDLEEASSSAHDKGKGAAYEHGPSWGGDEERATSCYGDAFPGETDDEEDDDANCSGSRWGNEDGADASAGTTLLTRTRGTLVFRDRESLPDDLPLNDIRRTRLLEALTDEEVFERDVQGMSKTGFSADNPQTPVPQALFNNYRPCGIPAIRRAEVIQANTLRKRLERSEALRRKGMRTEAEEALECPICRTLAYAHEEPAIANALKTASGILDLYDATADRAKPEDVFRTQKRLWQENIVPLRARGIEIDDMHRCDLRSHFWYGGGCGNHPDRKLRWQIWVEERKEEDLRNRLNVVNPVTKRSLPDHRTHEAHSKVQMNLAKLSQMLEAARAVARGEGVASGPSSGPKTRTLSRSRTAPRGAGGPAAAASAGGGGGAGGRDYRADPPYRPLQERAGFDFYSGG